MENRYDLVIIGAGPGGYEAAVEAGRLGKMVAVIESGEVGGTCLNRGCIPTKALLHSAAIYRDAVTSSAAGVLSGDLSVDVAAMHARKEDVILKLRRGIDYLLKSGNIDLFKGKARICAPDEVHVDDGGTGKTIFADRILIASGGRPAIPPIEGRELANVMTSDDILSRRDAIFSRLAIIGGGVIGLEFATLYADLGSEVTVIEALDRLLPVMDGEVGQAMAAMLKKRGVKAIVSASVDRIEDAGGEGLRCCFTERGKAQSLTVDGILIATGRKPDLEGLFDPGLGIRIERGFITVDEDFKTSADSIYAVGDVTGGIQLAHAATAQGIAAVDRMFGTDVRVDLSTVPSCVYTDPEIASVGLTLDEALNRGLPAKASKYQMISNGRSVIDGLERGFVKIIYDSDTGRLLGAQLVCGRATDLVGELATAISAGLTVQQLASVIRPHPTYSEGLTKAFEAAAGSMEASR